ncbi:MAG: 1-acyl-sn-glycerol-3-phosphate acyltransferase [Candidatus Nomurabacteria bacterium]|jgi:hypothetical protein|nr:1-acyl-sn-glycerol-3-phosphate acyltransferase [Candidatus Nomurabacteria bacterium]
MTNPEIVGDRNLVRVARELFRPLFMQILGIQNPYLVELVDPNYKVPTGKPSLFIVNHTNGQDFPSVAQALWPQRASFELVAAKDGAPDLISLLAYYLQGATTFTRGDKKDSERAENSAVKRLKQGHNLFICPTATWDPTPPVKGSNSTLGPYQGAIRIAEAGGAYAIPTVLDYTEDKVRVDFMKPFDYSRYENDAISAINALWGELLNHRATMWEKYHGSSIDSKEAAEWWKKQREERWLKECPLDLEREVKVVLGYKENPKKWREIFGLSDNAA